MYSAATRTIFFLLTLLYLACLIYWMFIGFGRSVLPPHEEYMYNITPFATIKMYFNYFDHYNPRTWAVNVFGNVGVFIPFGFMLPIVFRWGYLKFASVFILSLTLLELGQMVSKRGSFDIDDIILNTAGATIGFILYLMLPKPRKSVRRPKGSGGRQPSIRSK